MARASGTFGGAGAGTIPEDLTQSSHAARRRLGSVNPTTQSRPEFLISSYLTQLGLVTSATSRRLGLAIFICPTQTRDRVSELAAKSMASNYAQAMIKKQPYLFRQKRGHTANTRLRFASVLRSTARPLLMFTKPCPPSVVGQGMQQFFPPDGWGLQE